MPFGRTNEIYAVTFIAERLAPYGQWETVS